MINSYGYPNIASDVAKNVMEIAEQIQKESENPEPNTEKIQKLTYHQLMVGLLMNGYQHRNYKLY